MFDSAFQPLGLRVNQFSILTHAADRGPIDISDLARRLVMDRTTLSRDLGPLEKRRWGALKPLGGLAAKGTYSARLGSLSPSMPWTADRIA